MPEKKLTNAHPSAGNAGRRMLYIMLTVAILIALFLFASYPFIIPGAPDTATIKIPQNATEDNLRDSLEKYFGVNYSGKVMRLVKMRNIDLKTRNGAYTIYEGTNALKTMRQLTSGGQTPVRLTINGFRSLPLLVNRIADKVEIPADSIFRYLEDPKFMAQYGLTPQSAMALFIDDTYEVYWTSTAKEVLEKIGKNYQFIWGENRRYKADALNLTPAQIMILASIVDEETNRLSEKGKIGRLYLNRIEKGMRLQADPTVRFALKDFTIKRITKQDLQIQSVYNTYLHPGLPPGPIRTTNKATIDAILNSEPNEYLYMCAKEVLDGTHNFAKTYEEHTRNALKYQQALDQRGIKR